MPELFAPKEYWQASPELREEISNGCGPKTLGFLVPDTMWGLCVSPCCDIHDWMYRFGWSIEHKAEADRVFLNNLIRLIQARTRNRVLCWLRLRRARTYYEAVRIFGGPAFWAGKNQPEEVREI